MQNVSMIKEGIRTAIAIGKFDGMHLGHRKLLDEIISYKEQGLKSLVVTFESPFSDYFTGQKSRLLTPKDEKIRLLEAAGIDYIYLMPVNQEMVSYHPESFVREILSAKLRAGLIAAGSDLSFGHKGAGDLDLVRRTAASLEEDRSFRVVEIEKVKYRGEDISSSLIRTEVSKGDMEAAKDMLGRPYTIEGRVVRGNRIGKTIGFPTANLIPADDKLMPPYGVYISETEIEGTLYRSITNIGKKPTVKDDETVTVETHINNFERDIYGAEIKVRLLRFVRPEMKFDSIDELKTQIKKDSSLTEGRDGFRA